MSFVYKELFLGKKIFYFPLPESAPDYKETNIKNSLHTTGITVRVPDLQGIHNVFFKGIAIKNEFYFPLTANFLKLFYNLKMKSLMKYEFI